MKLFKKLAAAALAAVLALSMVGCGKANSVNSTKQFVLDLMADYATLGEAELSNTAEMDGIAQKLLNKAAELYGSKEQNEKSADALLKAASKEADVGFDAAKTYMVNYAEDYQYKSSLIMNAQKQYAFFSKLMTSGFTMPENGLNKKVVKKADIGVAVGKIGDKTYVVVVTMPTELAAAPGNTPGKD